MSEIYREELLFEARNPRKRGVIQSAEIHERKANPSCGDTLTIYARVSNGSTQGSTPTLEKISFDGHGCVLSMASASVLAQTLEGKSVEHVLAFTKDDVMKSVGMSVGPMRENCVLLALEALKRGITVWKQDLK